MENKSENIISEAFSRYLTGFALSKALAEDYARVISKIENVSEGEVKDRVWKRCQEVFDEALDKQRAQIEAAPKAVL